MSNKKSTPAEKTVVQPTADAVQVDDVEAVEEVVVAKVDEPVAEFDVREAFPVEPEVDVLDSEEGVVEDDVQSSVGDYANTLMTSAPEGLGAVGYKLGGYLDAMQPNVPQDDASLQRHQLKLRSVINNILDLDDAVFGGGMKFLAGVVRTHRSTIFSESMIFRGFDRLRISRGERQRLETLISLLLATADVNNPKDVNKSVDMKVVYRFVNDNNQQQKLQSFYGS